MAGGSCIITAGQKKHRSAQLTSLKCPPALKFWTCSDLEFSKSVMNLCSVTGSFCNSGRLRHSHDALQSSRTRDSQENDVCTSPRVTDFDFSHWSQLHQSCFKLPLTPAELAKHGVAETTLSWPELQSHLQILSILDYQFFSLGFTVALNRTCSYHLSSQVTGQRAQLHHWMWFNSEAGVQYLKGQERGTQGEGEGQ